MLDFIYNTPTKVIFGKDKHKEVGKIISQLGFNKIMMQYGKNSIKKSGLYQEVMDSLSEYKISVVECGGVEPNPKLDFVRKAVQIAKKEKVQMILAVGGGSVLDSCKGTALGAKSDHDVWDFFLRKAEPKNALPVGCILTISAAGSEMSNSAVLTDSSSNEKRGCTTELNRCKFAILNPSLTCSVNLYQTGCGIVDMMTHTMERYFTNVEPTEITDGISKSLIKSIINAGLKLAQDLNDYQARATIMWASSLAHNGLTGCGRENYLAVHQLEHAVSGIYDHVAHGAGLAVLYPAWAKYVCKYNYPRFADFFRFIFEINQEDDEKATLQGIEKLQEFFVKFGMPTKLREFGIASDSIKALTDACTYNGTRTIKSYIPLGQKEISEIFASCY